MEARPIRTSNNFQKTENVGAAKFKLPFEHTDYMVFQQLFGKDININITTRDERDNSIASASEIGLFTDSYLTGG